MIRYLAVLLFLPAPSLGQERPVAPPPRAAGSLPASVEKAVRKAVCDGGICTAGIRIVNGEFVFAEEVVVPVAISEGYSKHPGAILALLLKMAEEAEPYDSMKAVTYTIALIHGPGVAVVCERVFDKSKYDEFHKAWGMTTRQHWIGKIEEKMQKDGRPVKQKQMIPPVPPPQEK